MEPGTYSLDAGNGKLLVKTRRTGAIAKAGHDLTIEVASWSAKLELGAGSEPGTIELTADAKSLRVLDGRGGMSALDDDDKAGISQTIDQDVLMGTVIAFRSTDVTAGPEDGGLTVNGELELFGRTSPLSFRLMVDGTGHLTGGARFKQTDFGMKPYTALFGTLKVADEVEITVDAKLSSPGQSL